MARQRVTQTDLAKYLGISQMTVSYALQNSPRVSEITKQKVWEAARVLGYRAHRSAQSLRRGHTGLVAVLGLKIKNSAHDAPIVEEFAFRNLTLVLREAQLEVSLRYPLEEKEMYALPPWDVDAAILLTPWTSSNSKEVEEANVPYVVINGPAGDHGVEVWPDDKQGTRLALDYLWNMGHSRIVYVGSPPRIPVPHPSELIRRTTYESWMQEKSLPILWDPSHVIDTQDRTKRIEFWETIQNKGVTAVLTYHAYLAVELLLDAYALNIKIPEQVSLMCFNDVYPTNSVYPRLTCIHVPFENLGTVAGKILIRLLKNEPVPRQTELVPCELLERDSVRCLKD